MFFGLCGSLFISLLKCLRNSLWFFFGICLVLFRVLRMLCRCWSRVRWCLR